MESMKLYDIVCDLGNELIDINQAHGKLTKHFNELQAKHEEELKQAVIDTVMDSGIESRHFDGMSGDFTAEEFVSKMREHAESYYTANHETNTNGSCGALKR